MVLAEEEKVLLGKSLLTSSLLVDTISFASGNRAP